MAFFSDPMGAIYDALGWDDDNKDKRRDERRKRAQRLNAGPTVQPGTGGMSLPVPNVAQARRQKAAAEATGIRAPHAGEIQDALSRSAADQGRGIRGVMAASGPLGNNPYLQQPQQPQQPAQGNPMFPNGNPMGAMSQFLMGQQGAPGNPAETPVATPGFNPNQPAPQPAPQPDPQAVTPAPQATPQVPGAETGRPGVARPQQLLDFVGQHESNGNYNAIYGNADSQEDLSQYSLDEIIQKSKAHGQEHGSGAIGRYQFMNYTLEDLKKSLGLTGTEKFTPELQDLLGMALLERRGYNKFQNGEISADQFMDNLSQEWAALPNAEGKSHYEGVMGNKALTDRDSLLDALYGGEGQPTDPRMASSEPMAGEPAVGTQGLADRGPRQQEVDPNTPWGQQGMSMNEWIYAPPEKKELLPGGTGPDALNLSALWGAKRNPNEQIADRIAIAKAHMGLKQMGQPEAMTPYQRAQIQIKKDDLRRKYENDIYERTQGGSGGTQGDGEAVDQATNEYLADFEDRYGDLGTTGRRERAEKLMAAEEKLLQMAQLGDTVQQAEESDAIGQGWFEGRGPGKAVDWITSGFGNKAAREDRRLRAEITEQLPTQLFEVMSALKGATSERDLEWIKSTVPDETWGPEHWRRYEERAVQTAANRISNHTGISYDQAYNMASDKLRFYTDRLNPDRGLDQYREGGGDEDIERYRP